MLLQFFWENIRNDAQVKINDRSFPQYDYLELFGERRGISRIKLGWLNWRWLVECCVATSFDTQGNFNITKAMLVFTCVRMPGSKNNARIFQ